MLDDNTNQPLGTDAPDISQPLSGGMPTVGTGPAPPPAPGPSKPGLWTSILQGALSGLAGAQGATSFGGGLAGGAEGYIKEQQRQIENQQRQQQINVDVKFKSAQAAAMVAQAHMDEIKLQNLPQQVQDEHTNQVLSQLEHIKQIFPGVQITVTPNDAKSLTEAMAAETKTNGGVGTALHLNAGDKVYSVDLGSLSSSPAGLVLVNDGLRKMGKQPLDATIWAGMDTQVRNNYLVNAANFGTETPSDAKVNEYKGYLDTVKAKPDYPQKAADIADLQKAISRFQSGADAEAAIANQRAADKVTAEEKAKEPERQFQAGLIRTTAELNKANADATARALKADEMVTKEANDRDSDLKNIKDLKDNLAQIDNKNQAATSTFQVKFAEHEIVEGGVKRMNQTELDALTKSLGTYGRQFQSWVDKGFKGDMPKATKDDMLQILNAEEQARNKLYNSRVGNIDQHIRGAGGASVPAAAPASSGGGSFFEKHGGVAKP